MNTPRTDSQVGEHSKFHGVEFVSADFARQLERELIAEREKAKELRDALETTLYNRHQQADILNILAKHKV